MIDLFTPVVEPGIQHHNFVAIQQDICAPAREVLKDWASGFVDADDNFIKEFQTKFNQQFWELYLHALFTQHGFNPGRPHYAPDFHIEVAGREVLCEAATAQAADGLAPEWEKELSDFRPGSNDVVFHYATVRFANAVDGKIRKYRESYSNLQHVPGRPFILAVGQYEQPLSIIAGHVPALRLLFGLDEPLYVYGPNGQPIIVGPAWKEVEYKHADAPLPMGIFRTDEYSEISGVLCSALATIGKCYALASPPDEARMFFAVRFDAAGNNVPVAGFGPDYTESLADGLHLFINPFAKHPFDVNPFIAAGVAIHAYDVENEVYEFYAPQGTLSTRFTHKLTSDSPVWAAQAVSRKPRPAAPVLAEDKLYRQEAFTLLCDEEYLAHYRGWTIHVARDRQDQDWFGEAASEVVTSLHGLMDANRRGVAVTPIVHSLPTKEAAWSAVKALIDEKLDGGHRPT